MKERNDPPLQRRTKAAQHVPATDQIHFGKRRIGAEIVPAKNAELADVFADAVAVGGGREESPQPLGRNILRDGSWPRSGARPGNRPLVDVRASTTATF